jgi:glutamate mutase epsilon subunit
MAGIPGSPGLTDTKTSASIEANTQLLRLQEIKDMDKSDMISSEKKALRKEVRAIRNEMRSNNNGIYLSILLL